MVTITELNRAPDGRFKSVTSDSLTVNGTTTTDALNATTATIGQKVARAELTTNQTVNTNTVTQLTIDNTEIEDSDVVTVDLANDKIILTKNGTYECKVTATWEGSTGWTSGDRVLSRIVDDTNSDAKNEDNDPHEGTDTRLGQSVSGLIERSGTNIDVIAEIFHDAGQDETIAGFAQNTNIEVIKVK